MSAFCLGRVTTTPHPLHVALTSDTFTRHIDQHHQGGTMSQQDPQQPGQYPQQQPTWGAPQQPQWGAPPPQPPKKRSVGKVVGLGCLGIVGLFVVIAVIGAVASSGGSKTSSSGTSSTATAQNAGGKAKTDGKAKAASTIV